MFWKSKKSVEDLTEILDGCLKSKPSSQKRLFERFYGFGKSVCGRYASNEDELQEMINDGFLKVFAKISMYDRQQSFEGWFKTVMVRTAIDYHRKYHEKVGFVDIDDIHHLSYDDDQLAKLSAEEILGLVRHLPPAYRAVFSLYVVEGYSHSEIADLLKINEGTSRSNLSKARIKMKEMINSYTSDINQYKNV